MTSVLRHRAQIPRNVKYLLAVNLGTGDSPNTGENFSDDNTTAFYAPAGTFGPDEHIQDGLVSGFTDCVVATFTGGYIHKDLGRRVFVYDASNSLVSVFTQVQVVQGIPTEGVPPLTTSSPFTVYYIKTWSSSGQGVYVARTGP